MSVALVGATDRLLLGCLVGVLAAAFILGGVADADQRLLAVVEFVSMPLLGIGVWRASSGARCPLVVAAFLIIVGLLILPLLQLVPLPWDIWRAVPGRETAAQTLGLAGLKPSALPLSLTPAATWRAFLWMLPPIAVFIGVLAAGQKVRVFACGAVLILIVASLVLGGLQVAGGENNIFEIYRDGHQGLPIGLFANRNHQAVALAISLPLGAAAIALTIGASSGRRTLGVMLFVGLVALFVCGILATRSRAGLGMIAPSLAVSLFILFRGGAGGGKMRRSTFWVLFAVVVVVAMAAQLGLSTVLARFDHLDKEDRFRTWPTIETAAAKQFPAGSGLGSFDPVYRTVEPPDTVGPTYLNEAHNDYLQIWLEAGALGLVLVGAFLVWFVAAAVSAWRGGRKSSDLLAKAASLAILLLLIHSTFDYPLRTMALACVFGLLTGCLAMPRPVELDGASSAGRSGRRRHRDAQEGMEFSEIPR